MSANLVSIQRPNQSLIIFVIFSLHFLQVNGPKYPYYNPSLSIRISSIRTEGRKPRRPPARGRAPTRDGAPARDSAPARGRAARDGAPARDAARDGRHDPARGGGEREGGRRRRDALAAWAAAAPAAWAAAAPRAARRR